MRRVVNATPRPLYPREKNPVPIVYEAGWVPEPVWTGAENVAPSEIRSPDRPVRSESLKTELSRQLLLLLLVQSTLDFCGLPTDQPRAVTITA
jgi:hypothetical protein